jgi:ubiquitin-protein ligase E3 C
MLNEKISENTYDDEATTRPKTEISKVILEMIWRPLKIVSELNDENFNGKILSAFTQEILIKDPNFTTSNFIIPSLADVKDFPYVKLISFLYEVYSSECQYNNNCGEKNNNLKFNGFLLHAILQFDTQFLDNVINQQCLHKYLTIVGSMINCITKLPKPKENTRFSYVDDSEDSQSEDDSEDEEESPDDEMQSQFERIILLDIIKKLNEEQRVNKIVKNVDLILHLPAIESICIIAHNLLIYNRSAIHDYRLLDLLAFKPDFIRTLWYTLLTSKSDKNQLYISILSRGIIIG